MRMYAGISAVAATTAEAMGKILESRAAQGLKFGQGIVKLFGNFLLKNGARVAIGTSLFVAGLDAIKAVDSYKEGQNGLSILYGLSGLIGIAATAVFANMMLLGTAAIPVIGILISLLIGIAIIIEYIKDNPIQDWLERCVWGTMSTQRYPDMATEQMQFSQAIK